MGMIDQPSLSYDLFRLAIKPNKLYGLVTTGITFQGLNLDVGHLRYIRWSKTNDKAAWIAYNRMWSQFVGINVSFSQYASSIRINKECL